MVALDLAAWLKPRFRVWVYKVVRKLLTEGSVHLEQENESLRLALTNTEDKLSSVCVDNALLEHRYSQALYRLDALSEPEAEESVSWSFDWQADLEGEVEE